MGRDILRLEKRIAILSAAAIISMILIIFIVAGIATTIYVDREESGIMQNKYHGIMTILEGRNHNLAQTGLDWAQWDDTYQFIHDKNQGYIEDNLGIATMENLGLSCLALSDAEGKILYQDANLSGLTENLITQWIQGKKETQPIGKSYFGVGYVDESLILLSATPITDSSGKKKANGYVILAEQVDAITHENIEEILGCKMSITEAASDNIYADKKHLGDLAYLDLSKDFEMIHSTLQIENELGANPIAIKMEVQRKFYHNMAKVFGLIGAVCSASFVLLALLFLRRFNELVVARIKRLSGFLNQATLEQNTTKKCMLEGKRQGDEIDNLCDNLNQLLERLRESYAEIVKKNEHTMQQLLLQKLIVFISSGFVKVSKENMEETIIGTLSQLAGYFSLDRAYLCIFDPSGKKVIRSFEWKREGLSLISGNFIDGTYDFPDIWKEHISSEGYIKFCESNDFFRDNCNKNPKERESSLSISLRNKNRITGFLGMDSRYKQRTWSEDEITFLQIIANIFSDALSKSKAEEEVSFMAYYDQVTKLPNRTLFCERAINAMEQADKKQTFIGFVFLDLDYFKNINDTMGHETGDQILMQVADLLEGVLPKTDTVSRFGGDEFLMLIKDMHQPEDISEVMDKIFEAFDSPIILNGQEYYLTASAGVSIYPLDGEDYETLLNHADIAMYKAKSMGKNQYAYCTPNMKNEITYKMKLANGLYRALEKGELYLHYQPQVSMETKEIIGAEALIRWNHPENGTIPPAIFIPIAEQTGLINSIGEWVLRTACLQNKEWQDMGLTKIRIAVNISVHQLRNPHFVKTLERILEETGLPSEYLELEITESMACNETNYIIEILNAIKELGVSISIDDFGTEYSSLSRLKSLPIDRIKMDMQFVRGIEGSDKDKAITKVIINLAQTLGIKLIAEGVETETQLSFLSQRMCDEVQGFYYFKPMSAEQIEQLLRDGMDEIEENKEI